MAQVFTWQHALSRVAVWQPLTCTLPDVPEQLALVVAVNVRRRRQALGWTQADLAAAMVAAGCIEWTATAVANIERLDRPRAVTLYEAGALCAALRWSIRDLLAGGREEVADRLMHRSLESTDAIFQADRERAARQQQLTALEFHLDALLFPADYTRSTQRIRDAALVLYGRDVLAERDARLDDQPLKAARPQGRAQRLGHITRQLTDELAEHFEDPLAPEGPTEEDPF